MRRETGEELSRNVVLRVRGNGLTVEVTGPSNKTVRSVAMVRTAEVAW